MCSKINQTDVKHRYRKIELTTRLKKKTNRRGIGLLVDSIPIKVVSVRPQSLDKSVTV